MADIAVIFHWRPADMAGMDLDELFAWRALAVDRWNAMNRAED